MKSYYFITKSLWWWWAQRAILNSIKDHINQWEKVFLFTLNDECFFSIPEKLTYIPLSTVRNKFLLIILIPWFAKKLSFYLKKYNLEDGISFVDKSNLVHILAKKNAHISLRIYIDYYKIIIPHTRYYRGIIWLIQRYVLKIFYPKAGKIIVNSRENKEALTKFLGLNKNSDKIEVVYNSIDKKEIYELRKEKIEKNLISELKGKDVFITTWRLVREKQHKKIILSLYEYNKYYKNWTYLIVWDWPQKDKLKKLVRKLWLDKKILFLWLQKNVFKYLNVADLFLNMSAVEWLSNALLEAREMWLKIITTDFKSWAREIILWEDTSLLWEILEFPFHWKYGILIDNVDCIQQLSQILIKRKK